MRGLKLTFLSLTMVLALCVPALAQSASDVQYVSFCPTEPSNSNTTSVCDVPPATADNVGQGTDAVNDALADSTSSSSSSASASSAASASAESVLTGAEAEKYAATGSSRTGDSESGGVAAGGPEAADVDPEEGLASITELPETGGAPPVALGAGVLLVALGLMARRAVGR